jgi:CBS domain containing-hemolysin-like protein
MVTLENVLEELVGPIEDEFDQEAPLVRQTAAQTWEVNGSLPSHKLSELVGQLVDEAGEASTVSGLVVQRLGRFPHLGDVVALNGSELRVEEVTGTKVTRLRLKRRDEAPEAASAELQVLPGSPRRLEQHVT